MYIKFFNCDFFPNMNTITIESTILADVCMLNKWCVKVFSIVLYSRLAFNMTHDHS